MKDFMLFSNNAMNVFKNDPSNLEVFMNTALDASRNVYNDDPKKVNDFIRATFNDILGIDWKTASAKTRRQAWRKNKADTYAIIEDVIDDKLASGWGDNPFYEQFVEQKNLSDGDKNEFYVEDNSLMTVSKFAGNHHDLLRERVLPGKAFTVETDWYFIKGYNDFELFQSGKIDFAKMITKMYESVDKYTKDAIYTAFMSAPAALPSNFSLTTAISTATKNDIIELAELVKSATGKDVAFVGTKAALSKLSTTVEYNVWSENMKDEQNRTGQLGYWEGYTLMYVPRVNKFNTYTEATDPKTILIVPIDPEFKPIKVVNEGEVIFNETGLDGLKMDMSIEAEIAYKWGVAVIINEVYGQIKISS